MKKINLSVAILFMFATLIPAFVAQANMTLLHDWSEPDPKYPYGYSGSAVIWPFTSSTTKNAYIYNAPSSSYYNLSSSASASLTGEPLTNHPKSLLSVEYNASGKVQATSDWDRLEPHSGDGLIWRPQSDDDDDDDDDDESKDKFTYHYAEHKKGAHNSPASVKAITKKKKHKVSIGSVFDGTKQRSFSLSADVSHVEMQRTSPTGLDSDPWAFAQLTADWVKVNPNPSISSSPFTSMTPYCLNSGAGHTCSHEGDDGNDNPPANNNDDPVASPPPTLTPTDGTPNCPDCTSHCLSPCSCTNSGTCNGTVTDNTPDCSYCTDGCSSCDSPTDDTPNCQDCTSHCSSPCSCTNSGTCDGTVTTPPPAPTTPPPAPTTVSCGRSGCSESVSSANEHRVGPCSACGGSYWSCSWSASYWENEHRVRTCRYGTCGNTWRRCMSETPNCLSPNRQGKRCWAADP